MRSTRHRHFENKHYSVIFKTRLVEIESLSIEAQLITALSNGEKRYLNERISIHKKFIYQRNSDLRWPEERLLGFSEVLTNLRRIRKENHLFVDERIELISCNIPVGQQLCQGLYPPTAEAACKRAIKLRISVPTSPWCGNQNSNKCASMRRIFPSRETRTWLPWENNWTNRTYFAKHHSHITVMWKVENERVAIDCMNK